MGCFERADENCEEQPVFMYELNVQTRMFHEEPFKNGGKNVRADFCRADHFDDVMYVFGFAFLENSNFEEDRFMTDDEKLLSKRMMKGYLSYLLISQF